MASQDYYNGGPEEDSRQQPQVYGGAQPGYGAQQGGYDGPPPQQQYNAPPMQQNYNAPPPQNYNGPNGYTQNPPQYAPETQPLPPSQSGENFEKTFHIEKPKWNDLWAGILLIAVMLGFTAVSGIALHGYSNRGVGGTIYDDVNQLSLNSNTMILFAFVLAVAFVLSWGYLLAARAFTKQFIWITGILNIVLGVGTAIYYLYKHQYSSGIVFLLFSAFSIFCFITW